MKLSLIQSRLTLSCGILLAVASVAPGGADAVRPVNRVRPQENSAQFAKEAARVRLERLGERLGLSEAQMVKIREAQLKKETQLKKQESKLQKAEEKYQAEKKKIEGDENKFLLDYQDNLKKAMTSDQWEAYQLLLRQEAEAERQIEPPTDSTDGPEEIPDDGGFTGPAVKGPMPQIMYGN